MCGEATLDFPVFTRDFPSNIFGSNA